MELKAMALAIRGFFNSWVSMAMNCFCCFKRADSLSNATRVAVSCELILVTR